MGKWKFIYMFKCYFFLLLLKLDLFMSLSADSLHSKMTLKRDSPLSYFGMKHYLQYLRWVDLFRDSDPPLFLKWANFPPKIYPYYCIGWRPNLCIAEWYFLVEYSYRCGVGKVKRGMSIFLCYMWLWYVMLNNLLLVLHLQLPSVSQGRSLMTD
jgi:hypothetical protein